MRAKQSEDVDEPTTWPPVYTEPVRMMKKTDSGRCSAIMRRLTRPQQCQKAESVFLIFCKTFGFRRIGLHGSHVHCCGRQSQVGWGFPPFTQTQLNDRKWTIMCCDTINKTMVLALPWLSPEGLWSTNCSENGQLQSYKILNQLKHVSDLKWPMQSFSLFSFSSDGNICWQEGTQGERESRNSRGHLSSDRVGSWSPAGSELRVSSCRTTATGISCFYDHRETLWRIRRKGQEKGEERSK